MWQEKLYQQSRPAVHSHRQRSGILENAKEVLQIEARGNGERDRWGFPVDGITARVR